MLLTAGIVYFGTGYAKLIDGGIGWMAPENLARKITSKLTVSNTESAIAEVLISEPIFNTIGAIGTVASEIGVLLAIILGIPMVPFVSFLLAMHILIVFTYTPFFYELFLLWALFLPWDSMYSKVAPNEKIELVYDENCYFCARSLILFKFLDINDTILFYSQSDLPDRLDKKEFDYSEAMYAFKNGEEHRGYYAFSKLMVHLRLFAPVGILMRAPVIRSIGSRVYGYISENRSRHFACSVQDQ
jgi:predicted DCC family thiol-disulfide oxidoreductase YuxK